MAALIGGLIGAIYVLFSAIKPTQNYLLWIHSKLFNECKN